MQENRIAIDNPDFLGGDTTLENEFLFTSHNKAGAPRQPGSCTDTDQLVVKKLSLRRSGVFTCGPDSFCHVY